METQKVPVTRAGAFNFFFGGAICYGAGFGVLYGAAFGFGFFFIGGLYAAVTGVTIGLVLGLPLGILDGLILGNQASRLAGQGVSAADIGKAVRLRTPLATAASGALLVAAINAWSDIVASYTPPVVGIIWLLAVIASWHASVIITRQFVREYA